MNTITFEFNPGYARSFHIDPVITIETKATDWFNAEIEAMEKMSGTIVAKNPETIIGRMKPAAIHTLLMHQKRTGDLSVKWMGKYKI